MMDRLKLSPLFSARITEASPAAGLGFPTAAAPPAVRKVPGRPLGLVVWCGCSFSTDKPFRIKREFNSVPD